jgi:putative ABC transport system substrate-binding protein
MRRRALVFLLCGATAAPANAQTNVSRIGILGPAEEPRFSEMSSGLKQGLRDRGYAAEALEFIEGKVARGDSSGARAKVEDFVRQRVALVFVIGSGLAGLARQVSTDLPIIFITPGDPVAAGHVASLARPGGNTTAITFEFPELSAKRLELLQELSPEIRKVLVLYDPRDGHPGRGLPRCARSRRRWG